MSDEILPMKVIGMESNVGKLVVKGENIKKQVKSRKHGISR